MKHILIADDHEIVRQGVQMIARGSASGYHFLEASSCAEVALHFEHADIAFAILDIFLVDGNTCSLIDELVRRYPQTGILVYTMSPERIYGKRLLQKGVRGFLCKQSSITELESALERLLAGDVYISNELQARLHSIAHDNPVDMLSDRELEVVEYLAMGLGTKEISNHMHLDATTISTYRRRALDKLNVTNNIELKDKFLLYKNMP